MGILKWFFVCIFLLLALIGGGTKLVNNLYYGEGPLKHEKLILIPKGAGLNLIAKKLENENVIWNRYIFIIAARLQGHESALKAGEYQTNAHISTHALLQQMAQGKVFVRQYTIPEGLTSMQIVELLNKEENLSERLTEVPAEGSLLPETYRYEFKDTKQEQIAHMQAAMQKLLDEAWENRAEGLPLKSKEEALILASIIEKETGVKAERAKVAGVFINRLNINMPLQTDPTVIYAITEGKAPLGRPLYRRDLKIDSPYNTYRVTGLPPTPICNPGRASILAALNPETHNYLYFVADGTGGHAFGRTLAEHNANVQAWRKVRDAR